MHCVCPHTLPHGSRERDCAAGAPVRGHCSSVSEQLIGCVIGTSVPTENMLYVRVCKVDMCETCGLDWVGITYSASALIVNLGFPIRAGLAIVVWLVQSMASR